MTQSPCSAADILPCNSKIKERAWDEIETVNGKGVLFLLDGWDELPENLQNNSIFKDIIKSSPKHSLLLSTVVVTSRYVSSDELHRLATSRLETLGFADQEVKECIMDIAGNEEAAHACPHGSIRIKTTFIKQLPPSIECNNYNTCVSSKNEQPANYIVGDIQVIIS